MGLYSSLGKCLSATGQLGDTEKMAFMECLVTCDHFGDLNGYVNEGCKEFERFYGGFGYGSRNSEGNEVVWTLAAADKAAVNTYVKNKFEHRITYNTRRHSIQIDFLLTRTHYQESSTAQHRILVIDHVQPKRKHAGHCRRRR